jgi:archaellum component FlaC
MNEPFFMSNFLWVGDWTVRQIKPLFDLFTDEKFAPALASIIFAAALALCFLFMLQTLNIRVQIGRRTRTIRKLHTKQDFADSISKINTLMLKNKYLRHSWDKFRETLIEPSVGQDNLPSFNVVLNTSRPQDYFNIAESGLRFPVYKALPNLLVGIGLLLTFFGLVSALFFTTDAITNSSDPTVTQGALRQLLHAASFKFYTSIAGLGGSIILTLVLRYGTAKLESCFDVLASALEAKLQFVTPESIAFSTYREAQEQTKALKIFNTEVAISVGKRIEEALIASLPGFLAQAMAPIEKALTDVANKLTSMNEGAIGQMAGDFVDKLQGVAGAQMQGIADTLGQLRSSIGSLNTQLSTTGNALAERVGTSTSDLHNAGRDMAKLLQSAGDNLNGITSKLPDALERIMQAMTTSTERASQQFEGASHRSAERIEEAIFSIVSKLKSETVDLGTQIVRETVAAGNDSRKRIIEAGTDLASSVSEINGKLSQAVDDMRTALQHVATEIAKAEQGIGVHVHSLSLLTQATKDSENAMAGAAKSMREAGGPISESSRLIAEGTRKMSEATGSAERSINMAQAQINGIGQQLENTLASMTKQWLSYEQRFKGVDESLGAVLDRIVENVRKNVELLATFMQTVDERLSSAVDKLGGGISELSEFAETVEKATLRFNGSSHHNA